jgi:hypothetical protein
MPMREKYMRQGSFGGGNGRIDQISPIWNALSCVDNETFGAGADDVRVCSLECEL